MVLQHSGIGVKTGARAASGPPAVLTCPAHAETVVLCTESRVTRRPLLLAEELHLNNAIASTFTFAAHALNSETMIQVMSKYLPPTARVTGAPPLAKH